ALGARSEGKASIITLAGAEASRRGLADAMNAVLGDVQCGDKVFFHFGGQGLPTDYVVDQMVSPEVKAEYLQRGHAIHCRCKHPDVDGLRIDVMSKLRGCDPFEQLWERRTTIQDENANAIYEVLAIEDLVRAKKTQRDKDWPMIRRLVEAHYDENQDDSNEAMAQFWLRESRTPSMLSELISRFPYNLASFATTRPWLVSVDANDVKQIEAFLRHEEDAERQADEEYWRPLKEELVQLRLNRERRNK
ncbi:MAG: hypothetical protein ABL921_18500, partial [Pirellula sp.]